MPDKPTKQKTVTVALEGVNADNFNAVRESMAEQMPTMRWKAPQVVEHALQLAADSIKAKAGS